MQSGAALCPWALREDHRQVAFSFGRMVGCSGERGGNSTALVDCLREVPIEQLMAVLPYIMVSIASIWAAYMCVCMDMRIYAPLYQ